MHRIGIDKKMDGVKTVREILKIDKNATIWGYTAWADTQWADELKKLGVEKITGRPTPFSDFAKYYWWLCKKCFLKECRINC